ncbi:TPA: hypothetical protein OXL75_003571 [Acinetobacter baumannii]|jgi:hypothetical protein|nr:hypothetical protein [Acinetobacter baumannii]WJJ60824.1 hypothetical protein [SPHINX/BMMF group 2 DNA sequence]HCW4186076.1 hypothetical protein [Acinetobacter baumannii]
MCMSFGQLGTSKAEYEMNANEQTSDSKPEIKPFTTKAPVHVIEALDAIAHHMNMNRNALVLKLINQYLPEAFISYSVAYNQAINNGFADDKDVITDMDLMIKNTELSTEAEKYLQDAIIQTLVSNS